MGTTTHCHVCGCKHVSHQIYKHMDQYIHNHVNQQVRTKAIGRYYKTLAKEIERDIRYISDKSQPNHARLAVVDRLRQTLADCLNDEHLDYLTRIYRDTRPTTKVNVGYNQDAVAAFSMEMLIHYT